MSKDRILVILGPTSSGKSDVAIRLAKEFNGEIISADSRQVYRGLDVGTGKIHGIWNIKHKTFISKRINHYLINNASPRTEYNVAKFKKDARHIINYVFERGKIPIICGGTGFWIKAVVDGVDFPEVKPDNVLRNKLRNKSAKVLFGMLQKLDPERAATIDRYNPVRLIRAIEIVKTLGHVPRPTQQKTPYTFLQIGIAVPKEKLHKKIKKRLEERFKKGMIEEVKKLHAGGLSWKKIQSFGLGYYWIPLYLQGKMDKKELFEKIYQAEKDYAKRQMTWFKKDKRIMWLKNYKDVKERIKKAIKRKKSQR